MPYEKIKTGKNKGKYRNKENGNIRSLKQIQAYKIKQRKGMK